MIATGCLCSDDMFCKYSCVVVRMISLHIAGSNHKSKTYPSRHQSKNNTIKSSIQFLQREHKLLSHFHIRDFTSKGSRPKVRSYTSSHRLKGTLTKYFQALCIDRSRIANTSVFPHGIKSEARPSSSSSFSPFLHFASSNSCLLPIPIPI